MFMAQSGKYFGASKGVVVGNNFLAITATHKNGKEVMLLSYV